MKQYMKDSLFKRLPSLEHLLRTNQRIYCIPDTQEKPFCKASGLGLFCLVEAAQVLKKLFSCLGYAITHAVSSMAGSDCAQVTNIIRFYSFGR